MLKIGAEANRLSRVVSIQIDRLIAAVAYVLARISKKSNLYVLSFLISVLAMPVSVLANPHDPKETVNGFYHTSWTTKDGLSGSVRGLVQTADGFLWIGTSDGLFRFDGLIFERYRPQNGSLLHDTVQNPLRTPDGGLWIGYYQDGVSFVKNGKITNFTEQDGLPSGQMRCISQDKDGVVWAAFAGGLAQFDGTHWQKIGADWNYPGKTAWSVVVDHTGTVWTTSEDKIFFLPRGANHFQDAGLSVTTGALVVGPDNTLWLTEPRSKSISPLRMQAGLLKRSLTKIEGVAGRPVFDHNGGLWIGSWGNGILHIPFPNELHGGTFSRLSPGAETFTETEALSDNHVTAFMEDREGNIWIGTNSGLDRLRHSNVTWFALQPGVHSFSLIPGGHGEMFAASAFGEMVRVPEGNPLRNAPRNVLLAYRDPDGVIWLDNYEGNESQYRAGLFQWKEGHFTKVAVPRNLEEMWVHAMTKDSAGNFWISGVRDGIYKFRSGVWTHIDIFKDNPTAWASAAITDSRDRVWLAFTKDKQIVVVTEGAVKSFSTEKDLSIGAVDLLARSGEQIWAGGDLGIAFFQGDKFHTIKTDDGSTFNDIDRVVPTARDGVWLSARQGIGHIPEGEVEHVIRDPSYKVKYETIDQLSDLPDPLQAEGSGYVSAVQASDGLLWFATRSGVARIDPKKISKNNLAPPVSIRSISADGKEYTFNTTVSLPALTKNLRVQYTGLSLSIPERVRFRYKLDGWDKDWQDVGGRREAFYTNLAPGKYRFHVTACNNDGVWNDVGASLDFSVAPAWYQTNWFHILCVAFGVFIMVVVYRLRVRQIARAISARFDERLAERTRIARDLHDTFLQTIQGSKLVADDALELSTDPIRMRRAMEQLSVWLGRATQEGRAALNSLRTTTTQTNDLAEALRRVTEDGAFPSSMAVTLSVVGDVREMHPIVRDEIYRIGYEAIRNACMHSGASRLEVELRYSDELALRVSDNGTGIDPAIADRGKDGHFGLQGMRERAARIGGNLRLGSSPKSGTEIKLVVPGDIIFRKTTPVPQTLFTKIGALFKGTDRTSNVD
jgi:signal transduction histidine kinase/ligand-binding sensor domain-containing protein